MQKFLILEQTKAGLRDLNRITNVLVEAIIPETIGFFYAAAIIN